MNRLQSAKIEISKTEREKNFFYCFLLYFLFLKGIKSEIIMVTAVLYHFPQSQFHKNRKCKGKYQVKECNNHPEIIQRREIEKSILTTG